MARGQWDEREWVAKGFQQFADCGQTLNQLEKKTRLTNESEKGNVLVATLYPTTEGEKSQSRGELI